MTLKEIAELAGVSVATVSNVINGNINKVSRETREKVERIIAENDYHPNAAARSLSTQKSSIIILVLPHIGKYFTFNSNPYYGELVAEIEKFTRERNYWLMVRCVDDCREIMSMISSWNADGAIFVGVSTDEISEIRSNLRCPVVFIDSYCNEEDTVCVSINDYRGGYMSAIHLLNNGHRKIAFAGPKIGEEGVIRERFNGFRDACEERGVTIRDEDIFEVEAIESNSIYAGQDIAFSPNKYTAVSVMSDVSACGIITGLARAGVRVPEDISVVGFDNLTISKLMVPRLTTISQNIEWKARRAGDLLFEMIDTGESLTVCELLNTELEDRDTVKNIAE